MVHLHVRSQYSLLNGVMSLSTIIENAKNKDIAAVCLSDFHSMHGSYNFYKLCVKNAIKPLLGLEVRVIEEDEELSFVCIALDYMGYQDLLRLCSDISLKDLRCVQLEDLSSYTEHCYTILLNGGRYEEALIKEELDRKGFDYDEKIEKVEVLQ